MLRNETQPGRYPVLLLILVVCAAFFIWATSLSLPEVVASHFGASGFANGYMPRALYVCLTIAFALLLPLAMAVVPSLALRNPHARINLPNREYWLSPSQRPETIEFLRQHFVRFGAMLVIFFCYVHWLIVRANTVTPPTLSSPWFLRWSRSLFRVCHRLGMDTCPAVSKYSQ